MFQKGVIQPRSHTANGPRLLTKQVCKWWTALVSNRNGRARYTRAQLEKIRDSDERRNPLMKRVAAAHILMTMKGDKLGMEVMAMMFDRLEGKAPQRIDLGLDDAPKRIILIERPEQLGESPKEIVDVEARVLEVGGSNGDPAGVAVDKSDLP